MTKIKINSIDYVGRNLLINGNKVIIDYEDVTPDAKEISISVVGDISSLNVEYAKEISINGNVGHLKSTSGDIYAKNITGDVKTTSGDIECESIQGNVETVSGDVKSESINGNVRTISGDIKYKK